MVVYSACQCLSVNVARTLWSFNEFWAFFVNVLQKPPLNMINGGINWGVLKFIPTMMVQPFLSSVVQYFPILFHPFGPTELFWFRKKLDESIIYID